MVPCALLRSLILICLCNIAHTFYLQEHVEWNGQQSKREPKRELSKSEAIIWRDNTQNLGLHKRQKRNTIQTSSEPEVEQEPEGTKESSQNTEEAVGESELNVDNPVAEVEGTLEPFSQPEKELISEPVAESGSDSEVPDLNEPNAEVEPDTIAADKVRISPISEAEGMSEPEKEARLGGKSEPNIKAEEGISESIVEQELQGESESQSEPEGEGEGESESESEPEGEGEGESESETEPEGEGEGESESESEPEGEGEGESESESEPEGEGEGESESESEPEGEGEGESESESEPEGEGEGEPGGESEPEAEERPKPYEIIIPPLSLMVIIILGLLGLSQYSKQTIRFRPHLKIENLSQGEVVPLEKDLVTKEVKENDDFFSEFDLEVLGNLGSFNNRPLQLAMVSFPALLSLALCPFTLYLYEPLTSFFWPPNRFSVLPDINEAIGCFLAPAGLVYATSFGFAFQSALTKQQAILDKITYELGLLDQIVTLCTKISFPSLKHRMMIYKAVKAEAIFTTLQIMNTTQDKFVNKPSEDVTIKIWDVLDMLRNVKNSQSGMFDLDNILGTKMVNHILELNSICSDRMGTLHARIHPLKWAFLESLGFFSFFGILLIQTQSYRTELTMCIITVFSISLLCFVVSDLDSPFCGFFRVDVSALPEVIMRIRKTYELAKKGHNILVTYPEKDGEDFK